MGTMKKVLDELANGGKPKVGPQSGRQTSENSAGLTTLTSKVRSWSVSRRCLTCQLAIRPWRALHPRVPIIFAVKSYTILNKIYKSKSESESLAFP